MKRFVKFWVGAMSLCVIAGQAAAFELNNLGADGGWKNSPITTVLDRSDYTSDLGTGTAALDRVETALQNAFDTWAAVDANDRLAFDPKSDADGNYDVFDGPGGSLDRGVVRDSAVSTRPRHQR